MNLIEFLNWWEGFRAAVDPKFVTPEQWKILCDTIASIPRYQNTTVPYVPPRLFPGLTGPLIGDPVTLPHVPQIWCKQGETEGMPLYVGTPQNNIVAH